MTSDYAVLEYHYPNDQQFSLTHVTDDKERHNRRLDDLRSEDQVTVQTNQETINGTVVYLIYTNNAPDEALPDFETEDDLVQWLREQFDAGDLQIVLTVYRAYRGILEEKSETGDELELYKQMQLERIPEIIQRVQWGQSVSQVGAELLSAFILTHPMPNTNHRTGISLLDRYLTSIDPSFTMPDTGAEGEWYSWAVDFIHDSKRLLTLRRKLRVFRYAADIGYQTVRRKEGITIDLTAVDLDCSDPFSYYSDQHLERTESFVDTLLEQANATVLRARVDDGKQAFVDRLQANQ